MSANTEAQGSGRGLEAMKWVVVVALLLVAIVGNYLYRDIMLPLRALVSSNSDCCSGWCRAVNDKR